MEPEFAAWLAEHGLSKYMSTFAAAGYRSASDIDGLRWGHCCSMPVKFCTHAGVQISKGLTCSGGTGTPNVKARHLPAHVS